MQVAEGALGSLFRNLRTSASGLSGREAQRRLLVVDPSCQVQGGARHQAVVAAAAARSLLTGGVDGRILMVIAGPSKGGRR